MWMLLTRKTQLSLVVTSTILLLIGIQGAYELISGSHLSGLKLSSTITFIIGSIFVCCANFAWRWMWRTFPMLERQFFPDLNGKWTGTLQTTWEDSEGVIPGPINVTIWIRQSLFTINVMQQTNESTSRSTHVFIDAYPDADCYRLWYSYENQPRASLYFRSVQHEGVAMLEVSPGVDKEKLIGRYYTSRRTSGDIEIIRVSQ